ncbi:alpha-L-fucosidase [Olivibacter domesticus]|uniref:alpha-L-fucosidase n=1 Tax=Olivibacter domesticus TaxID=407022 RepID=A0A1H7TBD0_OLID1|nr:alpha-L-fucosidase [Olivibacter domesticus]SEL81988.1 alpha-L-fucosidase [Olivibacter domesticus]
MRYFLLLTIVLSHFNGYGQDLHTVKSDKIEWFKEARFGMFVHWGLYSLLGGTYKEHTLPDTSLPNGESWYSEWIQQRLEIPNNEYQSLVKQFNPVNFNADEWIKEAKNAGMKYFVITAKHHDGFALWDSKVSDYDIGATPFKNRDILGELVDACKKYGLKYGFYYSHWQDWEHPQGAVPYWKAPRPDREFEKYWKEKSLPQVQELIERYDPDLLWFDTWDDEAKELITPGRRDELITLIRKLSDKCLINGRIAMHDPGDHIDFLEMMDNAYPQEMQQKPWQTPATMNHTWAWHSKDFNWKSSGQMLRYLVSNAGKGGNYLLNIGPKGDGTMPVAGVRRLREMGAWMLSNGEAVYATQPFTELAPMENVVFTQRNIKGKRYLYIHMMDEGKRDRLNLSLSKQKIGSCQLLDTHEDIAVNVTDTGVALVLPARQKFDNSIQVVRLEIK